MHAHAKTTAPSQAHPYTTTCTCTPTHATTTHLAYTHTHTHTRTHTHAHTHTHNTNPHTHTYTHTNPHTHALSLGTERATDTWMGWPGSGAEGGWGRTANGAGCADGSCVLRGSNVDVEEGSVIAPRDAWISSRISARNSSLSPTWEVPSGGWREAVCAEGSWSLDAAAPAFAARLRPRPRSGGSRRGTRARAVDERVVRFLGINGD